MKPLIKNSVIVILLLGTTNYLPSCKKEMIQEAIRPVVKTSTVSDITQTSALTGGTVTDDGDAAVTEYGICWSTSLNPTISSNKKKIGMGIGSFTISLDGLTANTKYYLRAYAINSAGISYGNEVTFTTIDIIKATTVPTLTTFDVGSITSTSAISGGAITDEGVGNIIAAGICWNTSGNPTTENNKTSDSYRERIFWSTLNGLIPATRYYVRAYATNSAGTAYGNQISFTTRRSISDSSVPVIMTNSVNEITVASAVIGSFIISDGGQGIIDKGICWATNPNPTTDNRRTSWGIGTETYPDIIYGLHPSTKYYVRAYAVNAVGTGYGNELSFTTSAISSIIFNSDLAYGSIADADGNLYKTIQIGTQIWMAENLKTTKYNDGASIPHVTDDIEWEKLTTPAYCWYDNDPSFKDTYGALYNWYAVNTEKLCPTGWHIPTNADWYRLSYYLGNDAGSKMKETGTSKWLDPNTGASNISGFTAIPGGSRDPFYQEWRYSTFSYLGYSSSWWSATEYSSPNIGYGAWLYTKESTFSNESLSVKFAGLSVRCLKD